MSDAKIKVIVKWPDEPIGHVTAISQKLENLQKIVEGPIKTVRLFPGAVIICNEEGKLRGLQPNVTLHYGLTSDCLVGTIIIAGVSGEEFCDIPEGLYDAWKYLLKKKMA